MKLQDASSALHLKELEAKLKKVPESLPPLVRAAQDAVMLQKHRTELQNKLIARATLNEQRLTQLKADAEAAEAEEAETLQAAELEYQQKIAVVKHHRRTLDAETAAKQQKEEGMDGASSQQD